MNLKAIFTNPTFKSVLKKTGVVAGAIVVEGIKGVAIKGATKAITTSIDGGISGVKNLTLEEWVGKKKKRIDVTPIESEQKKAEVVESLENRSTVVEMVVDGEVVDTFEVK